MRKVYNYNNLKCSVKIAKLRLNLIEELKYTNCDEEIKNLKTKIKIYNKIIKYIDENLKKLNNVELDLFKTITCDNYTITKGVEKIADKYYLDTSTIWKIYYPRIKPIIKKLEIKEEL